MIARILACMCFSFYVHASTFFRWSDCVSKAAQNSAELEAALKSLEAAQMSARSTRGVYFPQISASLNYGYGNSTSTNSGGSTLSSATPDNRAQSSYTATLSASHNLFTGLSDQSKIDQADAQVRVQEASLQIAKAKVSADLKSAYSNLLYSQHSLHLQLEITRRREDNQRLVDLRFRSGRENKGSLLLAQAYLNQAHYAALQAKNGIATARAQLARVLGIDPEVEFSVSEDLALVTPEESPDFKQLARETPDYLQTVAQEDSAMAGVTLARSAFFPTLSLSANSGRYGSDWFPQNDRWSLGVSLSIPLFNGGRDYYGTQSAVASQKSATATKANLLQLNFSKLNQAYSNYVEAVEKLKVDRSFRDAAAKRAEIARSKYNNGLMTFDDWDVIENDLIARENSVLQSERDRTMAESNWLQVRGKGVIP